MNTMTTLNTEEQIIWDNIKSYENRTRVEDATAMDYYTSVPNIKSLGIEMPEKYLELCETTPRILLKQEEDGVLGVYDESGVFLLNKENCTTETVSSILAELAEEFPNTIFDNMNDIVGSDSVFDSRFPSHHYRMDLHDKMIKVSNFLFYKNGEFTSDTEKNSAAFDLVNGFFEYLYMTKQRVRRSRKNKQHDENAPLNISYSYSTFTVRSGYDAEDRAFVAVPLMKEGSLPVIDRDIEDRPSLEKIMILGENTTNAYCNAADFIVKNYDMNGNLK